jgi:hypothetical protein
MAEIELHILNGQCLNLHVSTIEKEKTQVEIWQKQRNNKNARINQHFTNKDAWVNLKRLYLSILY